MELSDAEALLERMKVSGMVTVVNQARGRTRTQPWGTRDGVVVLDSSDRGLSRSRNVALEHARGDICLLADDDEVLAATYKDRIQNAFASNPRSDVIIFSVQNHDRVRKPPLSARTVSRMQLMKVSSVQVAFRRAPVVASGVKFDTQFGAGSPFAMGEELIFLSDLRHAGLRISAVPLEVAHLEPSISSWFSGYDEAFFRSRGASFARAEPARALAYSLQWAIRKRRLYSDTTDVSTAFRWMREGIAAWRETAKNA